MEYKIDINGIDVGSGQSTLQLVCPPNSSGSVNLAATLDTSLMEKWFISHIQQGEKSTFNASIALVLDLPGLGKTSIPVWQGSESFQTDILGTINR